MHFKCNTSAKSVTPVQINYDLQKDNEKFCRPIWSHVKQWQKFCKESLKKVFSNAKKMASRNLFRYFFRASFSMFALLISNHTVFLVQFEINLHLWVFQKAEITLDEAARAMSTFFTVKLSEAYPSRLHWWTDYLKLEPASLFKNAITNWLFEYWTLSFDPRIRLTGSVFEKSIHCRD